MASLQLTRLPLSRMELLEKRAFDLLFASIALLLLTPVLAIVALLIKLDGAGPVFFLQHRFGFNQKPFRIIKFRTMVTDAERRGGKLSVGAFAGWLLLRNWTQAALLALLVPAWLAGEWEVRAEVYPASNRLIVEGLLLLAITYLTAKTSENDSPSRRVLVWIGGISLLPLSVLAFVEGRDYWWWQARHEISPFLRTSAWFIAVCGPLVLAFAFRKRAAWTNGVAAVWVLVIGTFHPANSDTTGVLPVYAWNSLGPYFWAGVGALGLVGWGLLERRREWINLGIAGFGLTVIIFYFSDVMDKLGRSASLIGLGVLFLVGGWSLERARRRLVARVAGGS